MNFHGKVIQIKNVIYKKRKKNYRRHFENKLRKVKNPISKVETSVFGIFITFNATYIMLNTPGCTSY